MAFSIILSRTNNVVFSFDDKRMYRNGCPSEGILDNIPLEIFKYLAECSPNSVTHEDIFDEVWKKRLKKEYPVDDISNTLKVHIQSIRKYLGDVQPYQYIQACHKSYKCNVEGVVADSKHYDSLIHELNDAIDNIVQKLELIRNRIDTAVDERWKSIYTTQFESTYMLFVQTKKKLDQFVEDYRAAYPNLQPSNAFLHGYQLGKDSVDEKYADSLEMHQNVATHRQEVKKLGITVEELFTELPFDQIFVDT